MPICWQVFKEYLAEKQKTQMVDPALWEQYPGNSIIQASSYLHHYSHYILKRFKLRTCNDSSMVIYRELLLWPIACRQKLITASFRFFQIQQKSMFEALKWVSQEMHDLSVASTREIIRCICTTSGPNSIGDEQLIVNYFKIYRLYNMTLLAFIQFDWLQSFILLEKKKNIQIDKVA